MGGKSRHGYGKERKSSSSLSSIFKVLFNHSKGRSGDAEDAWDEEVNLRRVQASDEDKGRWVAEPDIDRKATAYIAKFYKAHVSDSDLQTFSVEHLAIQLFR